MEASFNLAGSITTGLVLYNKFILFYDFFPKNKQNFKIYAVAR